MNKTVFVPASAPGHDPVTRLGGQPTWLDGPAWPMSAAFKEPMRFLAQFRVEHGGEPRLAYLFMTDDSSGSVPTWEPESGENALIVQPGGAIPDFLAVDRGRSRGPGLATEFLPETDAADPGEYVTQFLATAATSPVWLQGDETPAAGWQLVAQLDSSATPAAGLGGDWVGYAFLSPDGSQGRFLWQCT